MGYSIEATDYGYFLTFTGSITKSQMKGWLGESRKAVANKGKPFGVVVDMRGLEPLGEAARALLIRGQHMYKRRGMERSAVIVDVSPGQAQLERIANQSGISPTERYVNAQSASDPEAQALRWVLDGKEPASS